MESQSRVREEFARQADSLSVAPAFTDAEVLEKIRAATSPTKTMRILDLGCGPGGMRPMLSRFGRLVSTDFSFDALQFCKAQCLDHLVAADGMKLPFRDASFDAACVFDVIEHLPDDAQAAHELCRVLKPGGTAVITVPAYQWLWGRQDIVSHHCRRYNAPQLRDFANSRNIPPGGAPPIAGPAGFARLVPFFWPRSCRASPGHR